MKKALASIVLLASSAGVFALPAAARDRDDHNVNRSYVTNNYNNNYVRRDNDRDHDRDRGRDWRDVHRVNVRDNRGGYRVGFGFTTYDRNCR
jgi:Ni/Co efflux regulator RcnB